jgi:hypothetical protein
MTSTTPDRITPSAGAGAISADVAAALDRRIDDIVAFQKRKGPWYRDTGVAISAAAFFISVMTTVASWYRAHQQDINALKTELRAAIQQSNALQMQNIELMVKYKDDNQTLLAASSTLNNQNVASAQEAYSLVEALGDSASALDLTLTANALNNSQETVLAEELLKKATARVNNSLEDVAAWRILAITQLQLSKPGDAKASIAKAVSVFDRYPADVSNKIYVGLTQAYTSLYWANAILSTDCQNAKRSLADALKYLQPIPPDLLQAKSLQSEAARLSAALVACQQ